MTSSEESSSQGATGENLAQNQPVLGLGLAVLAFFILALSDLIFKLVSDRFPVFQMTAARGLVACVLMATILYARQQLHHLRTKRLHLHLTRAILGFTAGAFFLTALSQMPIADLYVITFTAPFFIAAMSWPILRERVAGGTWAAIALGFLGIVIAFQPSGVAFSWAAGAAFAATLAYAMNAMILRTLGPTENPAVTTLIGMGGGGALSLLVSLPIWVTPSLYDGAMLVSAGLLSGLGALCLSSSFRYAPAALIAPMDYTSIIWGVFYGYLFFGDVPGMATVLGAGVIIAAGLWLLRQQQ